MIIENYKHIGKGSVIGKFDIQFEKWGITVRDCVVMEGKNGRWINFPSRSYEKDGEKKWFSYVVPTKELKEKLIPAILDALYVHIP